MAYLVYSFSCILTIPFCTTHSASLIEDGCFSLSSSTSYVPSLTGRFLELNLTQIICQYVD